MNITPALSVGNDGKVFQNTLPDLREIWFGKTLQKPCKTCNVMFCAEIEHRGVHVQIKVFFYPCRTSSIKISQVGISRNLSQEYIHLWNRASQFVSMIHKRQDGYELLKCCAKIMNKDERMDFPNGFQDPANNILTHVWNLK